MEKALLRDTISRFFASPAFAVVGVSSSRKKFGNVVYRSMRERGLTVFPVHPTLDTVEGDACFRTVLDLPGEVKSVVTVVPPAATERVVEQCAEKGIQAVWMQQGSESEHAIAAAKSRGLAVISHQCVMMYLNPVRSFHALHRWAVRLIGKYAA